MSHTAPTAGRPRPDDQALRAVEFLLLDVGPQLTWRASRNVVMYTEVPWQMRWRKGMSNGVDVFVGARYMFD